MKRMGDPDVVTLQRACRALEQSTSTRMLIANLNFLWDRYVTHPPPQAWWVRPDAIRRKRIARERPEGR